MSRAVIDTNIFIRTIIKPLGSVAPIIVRIREGKFELIYSQWLLDELKEKLEARRIKDRYKLSDKQIQELIETITGFGKEVEPTRTVTVCRDVDDNHVIEAALEGNADYVVTGDNDLLSLKQFENIRFIQPKEFLEILDANAS